MILVSLLSISWVNAIDSNITDMELELNDEISDEEVLKISNDDENLEISNDDEGNLKISDDEEVLSAGVTSDNADSSAYLILDNDADIENINLGDHVVWIVSVINMGPETAKNVNVFDQLPDGLKYISHTVTKGTFNPKTGIWDIGDLLVEEGEVFLNITTEAITAGEKINKANLTTDSINLNNESYEEEEIYVFESDGDDDKTVNAVKSMYPTGNPLALVLISLFIIFVTSVKSKE